jgi:DNA-binding NtrC family response regulator
MSTRTPQIWILHRDERERAALTRMIAAGEAAHTGSPTDIEFETAPPPRTVVLGLAGDIEVELEFVHRNAERLGDCRWLLVTGERGEDEVRRLFDTVDVRVLPAPHTAAQLRGAIRQALPARIARDSLSLRRYRDRLAERFIRWFDDLGLGELLRAMDPKLDGVPLVVRGEPGTGRSLFARYVHTFGGHTAGGAMPFVEIDCATARSEADLLAPIAHAAGAPSATLLLERPDALAPALRRTLLEWIEYGLPPGLSPATGTRLRWVAALPPATSEEDEGDELLAALAGLTVSIPPLRERREAIASFARATSKAWSAATGQRERSLAPDAIAALELHSWPGNLRELESVLLRALAQFSDDPLEARHLRIDPAPLLVGWAETSADAEPGGVVPRAEPAEPRRAEPPLIEAERLPDEDELPEAEWIEDAAELPLIVLRPEDRVDTERHVEAPSAELEAVNTTELIETLLDGLRGELVRRNLFVLKELDQRRPIALANATDLRLGLRGLLVNLVLRGREEGDFYIASHHNPAGLRGRPALRILVRHIPGPSAPAPISPQLQLELTLCQKVAEAAGGRFTLSEGAAGELVVVFDLPAPA